MIYFWHRYYISDKSLVDFYFNYGITMNYCLKRCYYVPFIFAMFFSNYLFIFSYSNKSDSNLNEVLLELSKHRWDVNNVKYSYTLSSDLERKLDIVYKSMSYTFTQDQLTIIDQDGKHEKMLYKIMNINKNRDGYSFNFNLFEFLSEEDKILRKKYQPQLNPNYDVYNYTLFKDGTLYMDFGEYPKSRGSMRFILYPVRKLNHSIKTLNYYVPKPDDYIETDKDYLNLIIESKVLSHLSESIVYPKELLNTNLKGRVLCKLLVGPDGFIVPGKEIVLETPHVAFTNEYLRKIRIFKFPIATHGGSPIAVWIEVPLVFIR